MGSGGGGVECVFCVAIDQKSDPHFWVVGLDFFLDIQFQD